MNTYISDWNFEGDLHINGQKNPTAGSGNDLVELLWRNGQVVLHSQTHRKQQAANNTLSEPSSQVLNNPTRPCAANEVPEDETVSWIHYPIEDSFEREFCSNFFSEPPPPCVAVDPMGAGENGRVNGAEGDQGNEMPPPRAVNFRVDSRECSLVTVGLSHCGSNKVVPRGESGRTVTSSSGGSGGSFGRASKQCTTNTTTTTTTTTTSGNTNNNNKRKCREAEELECQSEAAELESQPVYKSGQRSGTSRKSRAAEVHNLSERKRRDRINEKMKALQELIPHSNKTDKASMLDEAIEYLKSLQLQLQVMWMGGSGVTPMMFPGVQHYMSRMGPPSLHLPPRAPHGSMVVGPTPDPSALCQAQAFLNIPLNYHQMQNASSFPEQYARYMGFHPMQTVPQPMNMFRFNPQTMQQQDQLVAQQSPSSGGAPINGGLHSKNMG